MDQLVMDCIIVEDDIMASRSLERQCNKTDLLNLVTVCQTAEEALAFLEKATVDLIFLDVEMPGISGIDLLNQVTYLPQVIFTTSKTDYAFQAFQFQATDYLQKPVTYPRFLQAVEKASEAFVTSTQDKGKVKEVYVKEDGRFIRISFGDILYFENVGDYVKVVTPRSSHIFHGTLKNIDAKLGDPRFLKVHRSFIVNLDKIKDIEENTLVIEKKMIPISRANKPTLMNRLNLL